MDQLHIMQLNCNFVKSFGLLPAGIFGFYQIHAIPFNQFFFLEEEWPNARYAGQG
jgi:hypothetical protein